RFDALLCLDGDLFANVAERRGWVGDATQQRVERRGDVRVVGFYGYAGASHAKLSLSCVAAVPTDKSIGTQDAGGGSAPPVFITYAHKASLPVASYLYSRAHPRNQGVERSRP